MCGACVRRVYMFVCLHVCACMYERACGACMCSVRTCGVRVRVSNIHRWVCGIEKVDLRGDEINQRDFFERIAKDKGFDPVREVHRWAEITYRDVYKYQVDSP